MNSLLYLDLDHNQLGGALQPGRFDNLNTLGTLKLRANNITKPPWEVWSMYRYSQYSLSSTALVLLYNSFPPTYRPWEPSRA